LQSFSYQVSATFFHFLLKDTKLLCIIALVLSSYAVIYGAVYAQETTVNTTTTTQEQEVAPEIVGTGQEAVPVITANGSEVAQAAPAEAVNSLLNTIFTVAVPAITGLVVAVVAMIKSFTKDKKVNEALDIAVAGAKYVDTMAPKIQEQYVTSGGFKTAFELLIKTLPPDQKKAIEEEIIRHVPPAQAKIEATSAQINKLRSQLPQKAIADNDKSIGDLDKS
jgi:hypothetical protein